MADSSNQTKSSRKNDGRSALTTSRVANSHSSLASPFISPSLIEHPAAQDYPAQQRVHQTGQDTFNLHSLGNALDGPNYQITYGQVPSQRYNQDSVPAGAYYATQFADFPYVDNSARYNMQFPGQYHAAYPQNDLPQHAQHGLAPGQAYPWYPEQQQQIHNTPPYLIQSNQHAMPNMIPKGTSVQYGTRSHYAENRSPGVQGAVHTNFHDTSNPQMIERPGASASHSGRSSVVRGPPRKPRQNGHAIWIGNLPPQTDLMKLVFHVCKVAPGLESLFLISKSNCAFANFKDEAACAAAQQNVHDSIFQTVRLVSRLRRSSLGAAPGASVPTGPVPLNTEEGSSTTRGAVSVVDSKLANIEEGSSVSSVSNSLSPNDKFFIVKSLTVEDLELSVRNSIWATQSHNEEALNKAYESAVNVYLIFSANKSGEYFGYARMTSPINDDPAVAIEFAPKAQAVQDPELPRATPTPATEFSPRGRVIDDSARGTIFWEAEPDVIADENEASNKSDQEEEATPEPKAWGKPFKIEWVSTNRLPFYRIRGLRNPWNSNREVKIARDGTELEPSVGRRLISLFPRNADSVVKPPTQSLNIGQMGSFLPTRPFY